MTEPLSSNQRATMRTVLWIDPTITRGTVNWPKCAAKITTEESVQYRNRTGQGTVCGGSAKVDYRGELLCVRHAQSRALREVMAI